VIPFDVHLLPASYTPLEKALASFSQRAEEIPAPIRESLDPWKAPPQMLRVLAHAFSVDLWVDDWSEARKRSIIANAIRMHREKGTLAGVLSYLGYVDARLVEALVPPQRVFSGPQLTRAQREAWLSTLPQVQTWRIMERGMRGHALFAGGHLLRSFYPRKFPVPSSALQRLHRRVRWVVDGVETSTRATQFDSYFRLHIRGKAGRRVFAGCPVGRFFQPSSARSRLVTIQPKDKSPWRSPVGPHLEPVSAEPERVVRRGTVDRGVFNGRPIRSGFLRPSRAWLRIYWRFPVNDGRRVLRRASIQFMGVGRYRFPAHTAHLQLSIPGRRRDNAAGEGIVAFRTRFWLPHNPERVRDVRRAMIAAKRASDRVLIRFADRPSMIAGQLFRADINSFVVGHPGVVPQVRG
jgi:hypothetical protein